MISPRSSNGAMSERDSSSVTGPPSLLGWEQRPRGAAVTTVALSGRRRGFATSLASHIYPVHLLTCVREDCDRTLLPNSLSTMRKFADDSAAATVSGVHKAAC